MNFKKHEPNVNPTDVRVKEILKEYEVRGYQISIKQNNVYVIKLANNHELLTFYQPAIEAWEVFLRYKANEIERIRCATEEDFKEAIKKLINLAEGVDNSDKDSKPGSFDESPAKPKVMETNISRKNNQKKDHAVLLIHGIRTQAEWQQTAASQLEKKSGIRVIPTRYEFFDILRFLVPFDFVRRKPIDRIATIIRTEQGRSDKISIIAHSFGTYIICKILEQYSDIKFHRLIFCGGIVKDNFSWDMYQSRIAQGDISECHILNDCGMKDYLPVLAKSVTWGFGSSGRFGFGHNLVKDRYHQKGHSEFFSPAFISDYWIPFIEKGHIEKGDIPESVTPWWLSILTVIQIKYLVLFVILFLAAPEFNFTQNENEDSWRNQSNYNTIAPPNGGKELSRHAVYSRILEYAVDDSDLAKNKLLHAENNKLISEDQARRASKFIKQLQHAPLRGGINAIMFNANPTILSEVKLGEFLQSRIPGFRYQTSHDWKDKEGQVYEQTIIVYISDKGNFVAPLLSEILYGPQTVVDYKKTHYSGLENRDIAIFVGSDFKDVLMDENYEYH